MSALSANTSERTGLWGQTTHATDRLLSDVTQLPAGTSRRQQQIKLTELASERHGEDAITYKGVAKWFERVDPLDLADAHRALPKKPLNLANTHRR
jgi:hypothetical protein